MSEDEQRAFGREHVNGYASLLGDVVSPYTARIYNHLRTVLGSLARFAVEHLHADYAFLLAHQI